MHTLFLLGDSTCAIKRKEVFPETGWGESFSTYLADGWKIDNRALNGRSSKSFLDEGLFGSVLDSVKDGDAAIIQFGHNDSKPDPERYSTPYQGYVDNLVFMAKELKDRGVAVYFASSIARRQFDDRGILRETHGEYIHAMHYAAFCAAVPCIDVTSPTMLEVQALGDEGSKKYYMNFPSGMYENYPDGKEDNTHLRPEGARWVSHLIARELSTILPRPAFLSYDISSDWSLEDVTKLEVVD